MAINTTERSPLRWVGSKSKIADTLIGIMPEHSTYVEPFAGGASILFAKPPVKHEVLNDFNGDIVNFWRVVRDRHEDFIESFRYTPASRQIFEEYKEKRAKGEYTDEIERAHVFYYLNRTCFSGNMCELSFSRSKHMPSTYRPDKLEAQINEAWERVKCVMLEQKDFAEILKLYDSSDTFFYIDPPYHIRNRYATELFEESQYYRMRDICGKLDGRFLITLNDDEFIRKTFKDFFITDAEIIYTAGRYRTHGKPFTELVITNYRPYEDTGYLPGLF